MVCYKASAVVYLTGGLLTIGYQVFHKIEERFMAFGKVGQL